jgi:hypothetical protein
MRISRRILSALAGALLSLFLLAYAPAALAGTPASVTVRVEGLTETKLLPTQVTLTGTPVVKDGNVEHTCGGNTGVGALQLATGGNWTGPWNSGFKQYEIYSIEGENHVFEKGAPANYFWSFWLNDKESEVGACEAEVKAGDHMLFFPSCFGTACPQPTPLPLEVEAASNANVGEPTPVTVTRFSSSGVASEVAGAAVVGGGAGATTDSHGHAVLTFSHPGEITVRATAPEAIRAETTICVHNGNDGSCGTTVSSSGGPSKSSATTQTSSQTLVSEVAKAAGVKNGHVYSRHSAPRVLAGVIEIPLGGTLRQVRIRLERRHHGRCFDFSGSRESFVRAKKCGSASFFSVGGSESFSYLLPARLPAGRYVYDIEGVDSAGQPTKLVSGVSHVVFQVK